MDKLLRKSGKGFVLAAVLWAAALLTLICATADRGSRMDLKVCMNSVEELRCRWASRAGMDTAMAVLIEEKTSAQQGDAAADTENIRAAEMDLNDVPLEGCRFTVRFIDESGKLNINTATKEQLMRLVDITDDMADAILDWRDSDDLPSEGGVEGGYYENLRYWYTIRNGDFRTVRELLAVRDIMEDLFYGNSREQPADATNVILVTDETQSLEEERAGGWMQYLTCYSYDGNVDAEGNARININTANESRLTSSLGITQAQARWIVENRGQNQYSSIADLINTGSSRTARSGSSGRNQNQQNQTEPIDLETFGKIADKITVRDDAKVPGRINVNTASRVVLEALLGEQPGAEQIALNIISHRQTLENGMESIAELLNVGSMTVDIFKAIANGVTVRSDVYMVRCYAAAERAGRDGMSLQTEAIVDRGENPCKILYWYQGANN